MPGTVLAVEHKCAHSWRRQFLPDARSPARCGSDVKEDQMISTRVYALGFVALYSIAFSLIALATTGDPLPDVDVSLDRKPGGLVKQVKTDAQGNFNFGVVSAGDYVITVKPAAATSPRQVGAEVSPASAPPPGATAKSFFESRSNTVRTAAAMPSRYQVMVSVANSGSAMRTMQSDGNQQMQVTTKGGSLAGRIIAQ